MMRSFRRPQRDTNVAYAQIHARISNQSLLCFGGKIEMILTLLMCGSDKHFRDIPGIRCHAVVVRIKRSIYGSIDQTNPVTD
ncbi:50S ribosomal protein [Dirofilaria immitis]